jgi:hypothetical protein
MARNGLRTRPPGVDPRAADGDGRRIPLHPYHITRSYCSLACPPHTQFRLHPHGDVHLRPHLCCLLQLSAPVLAGVEHCVARRSSSAHIHHPKGTGSIVHLRVLDEDGLTTRNLSHRQ